jgi:hypothetical protein
VIPAPLASSILQDDKKDIKIKLPKKSESPDKKDIKLRIKKEATIVEPAFSRRNPQLIKMSPSKPRSRSKSKSRLMAEAATFAGTSFIAANGPQACPPSQQVRRCNVAFCLH